jgi:hypothetical protein
MNLIVESIVESMAEVQADEGQRRAGGYVAVTGLTVA